MLRLHQDTFDLVSEGALWIDKAGKINGANAAAARLLGYSDKQLHQLSYFEINPHFSMMGWKKFWNRLRTSERERLETEFVNASGSLFSVKGQVSFDLLSTDLELCCVVFQSTESGRRQADLLEAVQRGGNVGGWEYNLANGQVYLSSPIREWLGWSPERDFYPTAEFAEKMTAILSPDALGSLRHQFEQLLQGARSCDISLELPDGKGNEKPFRLQGNSVENELEVFKIYGSIRPDDQAGKAMVSEGGEAAYPFSLDRIPEAIYWVSFADQRIVFANAAACELTGYLRQEMIGHPAAKLGPPELAEETTDLFDSLREKKYLEHSSITLRKDGTLFPTSSKLHYYQSEDAEYAIVVAQDTSQERQDDQFLQLHTTTLNTLREWVVWLDAENKVVRMNAAARRKLSRRTSRKLTGLPILELMPGLEIPPLSEIRQEQLDGRVRSDTNYEYTDASGKDRILQCHFVQVAAASRLFLSIICRDVTAEVNNKRRLQQAKRRVDELRAQLESENEALKEQIEEVDASGPIITVSPKYQEILGQIAQVAGTDATVLVTGETGTGKELLARSIHNFSNRSTRQMVSVNCAALPENLIESELFGHERGSFTGAFAQKKGKFEIADNGTIFLDEIGELPLDMQAKILRALQEGEIQRIGSTEIIKVDVRIVAATNRDLEQMINQGTFREDLFYRLNVFPIHNLPLRERKEDIPVLVKHFTRIYAEKMGRPVTQINPKDLEQMQEYAFPGNVRELINLVERAVITSNSSTLNLGASLRALRRTDRSEGLNLAGEKLVTFEEMQRRYIIEALKRTKGKVTGPGGAAKILDVNGRTLMSKMHKLGIDRNEYTT
ncbi:MAG: PAS domain S-box-containing protein [Neolewinella sp.]|jgi:PAS domain S-box-containing protein